MQVLPPDRFVAVEIRGRLGAQIVKLGLTRGLAKACGVLSARILAGARNLNSFPTKQNALDAFHHQQHPSPFYDNG